MSQEARVDKLEKVAGQVRDRQPVDVGQLAVDRPLYSAGVEVVPGRGCGYMRADASGVALVPWDGRQRPVFFRVGD